MKRFSYIERASFCKNPVAKKLFELIHEKKTNLAFSADVTDSHTLLQLADRIGPEICVLKTHIDIVNDFSFELIEQLKKLAAKHQFLIFEDRKFADIGNTVKLQYQHGIFKIAEWADIVNAHALPGPGIIQGLCEGLKFPRAVVLIAEMSSKNNLFDETYQQKTLEMAKQFPEFVMGFVAQRKILPEPQWIYFTPGVNLAENGDPLGQGYITPQKAIIEHGSDVIIVGRGIICAKDPAKEAEKYRSCAWQAHIEYS